MIRIEQKIDVIEVNDEDTKVNEVFLGINSHWNDDGLVVIVAGDNSYTVVGEDLIRAAMNAQRSCE